MKITKRQLRRIIAEATSVINDDTGELLDFGDEMGAPGLPDEAWLEIKNRLGIHTRGRSADGELLSDSDFQRLYDEIYGKRQDRQNKRDSAHSTDYDDEAAALSQLQALAREAADDYLADNPDANVADIAYDLASSVIADNNELAAAADGALYYDVRYDATDNDDLTDPLITSLMDAMG